MNDFFRPGDRVEVFPFDRTQPSRLGTVAYVRTAPPDFKEIEVVSVVLDSKKDQFGYVGSLFPADIVRKL